MTHIMNFPAKKKLYMTPSAREQECRVNEMPSTSGLIQQTTSNGKIKLMFLLLF